MIDENRYAGVSQAGRHGFPRIARGVNLGEPAKWGDGRQNAADCRRSKSLRVGVLEVESYADHPGVPQLREQLVVGGLRHRRDAAESRGISSKGVQQCAVVRVIAARLDQQRPAHLVPVEGPDQGVIWAHFVRAGVIASAFTIGKPGGIDNVNVGVDPRYG